MDRERKMEIALAVHRLIAHNLWRRGKLESEPVAPKDLGDAIETVCGAAMEHLSGNVELEVAEKSLRSCEHALKQQECITLSTKKMLDDARAENRRLHAVLAAHRIKFRNPDSEKKPVNPPFDQSIFDRVKNDPQWRYVSVNRDGSAFFWNVRPFPHRTTWVGRGDGTPGRKWRYCRGKFDASDWRHSLLEREKK